MGGYFRRAVAGLGSGLLVVAVAAVTGAPSAAGDSKIVCDGVLDNVVVDHVVVPAGETCRLLGVVVRNNVHVETSGGLVARNSEIGGNVDGTDGPRTVRVIDSEVRGNIYVREATGRIVIGNAGCRVDPVVDGNVHLVENQGTIAMCQMTIGGNLHLMRNAGTMGVFDNAVGNNLYVRGNTGTFSRLRNNRVGVDGTGSLDVRNNVSTVRLRNNRVSSRLSCFNNTPRPQGSGNTAERGLRGQCRGVG